jgi:hypothetical protein
VRIYVVCVEPFNPPVISIILCLSHIFTGDWLWDDGGEPVMIECIKGKDDASYFDLGPTITIHQ